MQKEMQNKITRLLYELNALDKGTVCLTDMAAELGVSLRTLQRDMRTIQEAEFPLYCPQAGHYAFMEGFGLEKMELSDKEASVLIVMNEVANSLGGNFAGSYDLLRKRLLKHQEDSPFFVKISNGATFPDTPITRILSACVRTREKVTVCYSGGKRVCYHVRPLKILWVEGFWYLLALCDDGKLLKFRLEKITSATPMGKFFTYDAGIEKIIRHGPTIWFATKRTLSIKMEISAACAGYFKARQYFPLQKIEKEYKDGRLLLSSHAVKEEEILPTILYWIPHIKVLRPVKLALQVKKCVKKYLEQL